MTHASLFSGIGGFDLAAEWMGWDNIFHCEWNPFGQKVLAHHFPNSKSYNDITKTNFSIHEGTIDVLSGGFPCQPYSNAGLQLGKADERHLFPHMLRCIKEVKPKWVIGENVRGLVSWGGDWYSMRCVMTWKGKAMKFNRFLFQLQVSTHRTKDKEFGLLHTPMLPSPNSYDWNTARSEETFIKAQARHKAKGVNLQNPLKQMAAMGMLPTPTTRDANGIENSPSQKGKFRLAADLGDGTTSQLNPHFVGEMMGFPENWTTSPFLNGEKNQSKHTETQ
jgi:hypothetical protein